MKRSISTFLFLLIPFAIGCAQSSSEPAGQPDAAAQPAAATAPDGSDIAPSTPFEWPTFDQAVASAQESGKFVLIDIYAPWCGWCRKMQAEVYTDKKLQAFLNEHFELGRLNIDDTETRHDFKGYNLTSQELGYGLGAEGTPTTVFLDKNSDYITRLPGYADLATFNVILQYIATEAFRETTFQEYVEASVGTEMDQNNEN